MKRQLILASQSPRRRELLARTGLDFTIKTVELDESLVQGKTAEETVEDLARLKAGALPLQAQDLILAADTVVAYQGDILGKPQSRAEAREILKRLSGQTHEVFTGVALRSQAKEVSFVERTAVSFWPLDDAIIDWYVASEEPYDKAGAYGIQGLGALLVQTIQGDYFNVVGLPLSRVIRELKAFGISPF